MRSYDQKFASDEVEQSIKERQLWKCLRVFRRRIRDLPRREGRTGRAAEYGRTAPSIFTIANPKRRVLDLAYLGFAHFIGQEMHA